MNPSLGRPGLTRRTAAAGLFLAALALSMGPTFIRPVLAAEGIEVQEPWARATGETRTTTAYLVLINHTENDDKLVSVSSPMAEKCILEKNGWKGLTPTQKPVENVGVKAMARTELKPGGLHIRLLNMTQTLRPKDSLSLTLTFASGARVEVTAEVANRLLGDTHSSQAATAKSHRAAWGR